MGGIMFYLLVYDIGDRRVNKIAKVCVQYGVRVQNSVFEMRLDNSQLRELTARLALLIKPEEDSIRIYRLRKYGEGDMQYLGKKKLVEIGNKIDIIL